MFNIEKKERLFDKMRDSLNAVFEITACIWWFSFILGTVSIMVAFNESFKLWGCWLVSILMIPGDSNQESFGATCSEWHDHESSVSLSWVLWKGTILQDLCLQWATPSIYDFTPFSSTLMLVLALIQVERVAVHGPHCFTTPMKLVGITMGSMQFLLFTWSLSISWSSELLGLVAGAISIALGCFNLWPLFLNTWCILIRFFSILSISDTVLFDKKKIFIIKIKNILIVWFIHWLN